MYRKACFNLFHPLKYTHNRMITCRILSLKYPILLDFTVIKVKIKALILGSLYFSYYKFIFPKRTSIQFYLCPS